MMQKTYKRDCRHLNYTTLLVCRSLLCIQLSVLCEFRNGNHSQLGFYLELSTLLSFSLAKVASRGAKLS